MATKPMPVTIRQMAAMRLSSCPVRSRRPTLDPPAAQYGAATGDPSADHQARVIEVIDGDTIRVKP
jgi:endonuclease YncB( thermonuclease family)